MKCFQFFLGNCEVSSILMGIKVSLFSYQFQQLIEAGHQRIISIGETVSFRLGCIFGTRWQSSCLVTFTFLVHFLNSSFLFFSFFFDWLSLGTTWRLASGVVKEVSCVLAACVISSSAMNSVSESFIKLSMSSSYALYTSSNKAYYYFCQYESISFYR